MRTSSVSSTRQQTVRLPPILLLIGISAMGPVVLNGVLPATTQVMRDLSTSYGMAQLVLTVYLFATMLAQIVLGNWADRFGRRPVMLGSLLVFSAGGVVCMLATSIEVLLIGRFIQGLGSAVCVFLPRTIVRDVYPRDKSASIIGYMTTAMMVAPLFGPALGGWVTDVSTWRWMYAGLAFSGLVFAGLSWRYLHETLDRQENRPVGSRLFASATALMRLPVFVYYLLVQCGSVGAYYSFLGGAPYVIMELRGISASDYGLWFMMVAIGYLSGNFLAGRLSEKYGVDGMIGLSLVPAILGVIAFWSMIQWHNPAGMFFPMLLIALSNGMCLPNVMSAIMSVRVDLAGSASGLAGTVQVAVGIVFTLFLGLILDQSELPVYLLITLSNVVLVYGYYRLWRHSTPVRKESHYG